MGRGVYDARESVRERGVYFGYATIITQSIVEVDAQGRVSYGLKHLGAIDGIGARAHTHLV